MAVKLYKVLVNGRSCHGGDMSWSLPKNGEPGEWHSVTGPVSLCSNGLHLTPNPGDWWKDGATAFLVEADGIVGDLNSSKVAARRVRLLNEVTANDYAAERGVRVVKGFLSYGSGDGDGSGSGFGRGYGYGCGYGDGSGSGYGCGYGDGSGSGYGYGYGDGSGFGYGDGYGSWDGYGYGSWDGYGYGSWDGSGFGYGDGYGYGSWDGSGSGDGYGSEDIVNA